MIKGMDNTKLKKKQWKTIMERDIYLHKDLAEAYFQRGKTMGDIAKKLVNKPKKKTKSDK